MIKNQSTISKDDREILSNIDVTYEEWGATQQSKKGVRKLIEPIWLDFVVNRYLRRSALIVDSPEILILLSFRIKDVISIWVRQQYPTLSEKYPAHEALFWIVSIPSIVPNAWSVTLWASVKPVAPVIIVPS